ncbi:hypothetical protein D3C75_726430 [compost metagenome]
MPEVDLVQILLQNFILGQSHLQMKGVERLLDFTGPGAVMAQVQIAGQLLRHGTGALLHGHGFDILNGGPGQTLGINPQMAVKAPVLH